MGWELSFFLSK